MLFELRMGKQRLSDDDYHGLSPGLVFALLPRLAVWTDGINECVRGPRDCSSGMPCQDLPFPRRPDTQTCIAAISSPCSSHAFASPNVRDPTIPRIPLPDSLCSSNGITCSRPASAFQSRAQGNDRLFDDGIHSMRDTTLHTSVYSCAACR